MKSKKPNRDRRKPSPQTRSSSKPRGERGGGRQTDLSAATPGADAPLIAAIGASAGGIESVSELLRHLPADIGMAFVLIQHLDPKHESVLASLLAKQTSMPVREVTDGMRVEANHVYVIPPNAMMSISDHTLRLAPREESTAGHMTVDHFMRSLAESQGNRAVAVILSGYGTDGTLGMAEIQSQGGVTFAQDDTAKFAAMPRNAISSGWVDYVLPPKGIARELARIAKHPYVVGPSNARQPQTSSIEGSLGTIFDILRKTTGVDFAQYRQSTIVRRIHRRMVVHKMDGMKDYLKHLRSNPLEVKALYLDMLINVTSFFRNPAAFQGLKRHVFPAILKNRPPELAIRVWTPGCASGEETYSVAISLLEFLAARSLRTPVQLFGTDVNDAGVERARDGVYPENIENDVSADRLRRFFTKADTGYRISKNIRDVCIFAQHNVLNDPPFSQMDLICCRNLLIYLEPSAQSRVISLFHYATRPAGFLMLGTSEGVGAASHLFAVENRAFKFFSKKGLSSRPAATFSLNRPAELSGQKAIRLPAMPQDSTWNYIEVQREFDRRLLGHYSPAAVFINEDLDVVHVRGRVNRYFKVATGRASLNVLKMAREGLLLDLRNAINRSKKDNELVRKKNVAIIADSEDGADPSKYPLMVNFEVSPVRIGSELYFEIVLEDAPAAPPPGRATRSARVVKSEESRVARLDRELAATKEYLQSVIETQEATNEELQSANEEILSSNEELQSTNEEVETAKEELQSANEELSTVNDELRSRNAEVSQINTDLTNLLESIDMAIVMVGSDLTIRRFTPRAETIFGLLPQDLGRRLGNIKPGVELPDFEEMVNQVMSNARTLERTLRQPDGQAFQLRVVPYKLADGSIDGTVITVKTEDGNSKS